jgi:histidyl-tRNA synthetase
VQCDLDTLGSTSPLADAEVLCAHHDALAALKIERFSIQLNSRRVLECSFRWTNSTNLHPTR